MKIRLNKLAIKKLIVLIVITLSLTSCLKEKEINTNNLKKSYNKEIHKLDLSNNSLVRIPALKEYLTGETLDEIKIIDLSGNKIESIDGLAFEGIKSLEEVNLSGNKIKGLNLRKIHTKEINLSNNNIEKISIYGTGITKIDLTNNNLRFGNDINLPSSLIKLNLSNNKLINLDGFEKFKLIQSLNLMGNELENKSLLNIKNYKNLKNLNLSKNNISKEVLKKINKFNLKNK